MKHSHKWIAVLLEQPDSEVDAPARVRVLENCGRACIPNSFVARARECRQQAKDMDDFLARLGKVWSHVHSEGDEVYVVYEKCYCPLVKDFPGQLSPTWCQCSQGWVKQLFEGVLDRPVELELMRSIRQGDECCRFTVHLPEWPVT
jgi:predicted hydrocarbon binding protein